METLTNTLQARASRDQRLAVSGKNRDTVDESHSSKKEVERAKFSSKALLDGGKLPEDLLARIFGHLPSADLLGCAAVCRHWQKVVYELTGNAFTYKLDLECPFCHAEVGDYHKPNLQGSSE